MSLGMTEFRLSFISKLASSAFGEKGNQRIELGWWRWLNLWNWEFNDSHLPKFKKCHLFISYFLRCFKTCYFCAKSGLMADRILLACSVPNMTWLNQELPEWKKVDLKMIIKGVIVKKRQPVNVENELFHLSMKYQVSPMRPLQLQLGHNSNCIDFFK